MQRTNISYLTHTWNPITGCSPISAGCKNCWAERISKQRGWKWGTPVFHNDRLGEPLGMQISARIGTCFMSDIFHESVRHEWIEKILFIAKQQPYQTFVICTKRPENIPVKLLDGLKNIWIGVTVENESTLYRTDYLRKIKASVKFISFEPLIGQAIGSISSFVGNPLYGIDWVIVGGESGAEWRPMDLEWARAIRDACKSQGIPFYFKQVSAYRPTDDMVPEDLRIREYPDAKK